MESAAAQRTTAMTLVAVLALFQSLVGVLRALHWFDLGTDLVGQGLLLLPLVGVLAFFRGLVVAGIALLYALFAYGLFFSRAWARWVGITAAALTLLLVINVIIQGEPPARAIIWSAIPLIMLCYLLSGPPSLAAESKAQ